MLDALLPEMPAPTVGQLQNHYTFSGYDPSDCVSLPVLGQHNDLYVLCPLLPSSFPRWDSGKKQMASGPECDGAYLHSGRVIIYAAQSWLRFGRRYVLFLEGKAGVEASPLLISSKGLVFVLPHGEQVCKAGSFLGPGPLEELGMGSELCIQPPERKPEAEGPQVCAGEMQVHELGSLSPAWLGYGPNSHMPSFSFFSLSPS